MEEKTEEELVKPAHQLAPPAPAPIKLTGGRPGSSKPSLE
jgi:hypothetical protein